MTFGSAHHPGAALAALILGLTSLAGLPVSAQDAPAPPAPCSSDPHDDFHFWAGHWDVTQNDQPAGTNHIEIIDGGCAMLERWTSAQGNFSGHSLNYYDTAAGVWRQLWVDSGGTVLKLEGGLRPGPDNNEVMVMVLEGEAPDPQGTLRPNRITWTPLGPDRVRQHWEVQGDDGWTTAFDGRYTRREAKP